MPGSPEKELPRDADAHMITAGVASVYTSFSFTRSIGSTPERHHARRGDDADELRRTGSASWTILRHSHVRHQFLGEVWVNERG